MPDNKTVYLSDDGYDTVLYKFIADAPGDLSKEHCMPNSPKMRLGILRLRDLMLNGLNWVLHRILKSSIGLKTMMEFQQTIT